MSKTRAAGELEDWLTLRDISKILEVEYNSARTYHGRAQINRRRGQERPGDLPPPDKHFGKSPVWRPETIRAFMASRPGRGTGGGRRQDGT